VESVIASEQAATQIASLFSTKVYPDRKKQWAEVAALLPAQFSDRHPRAFLSFFPQGETQHCLPTHTNV
jgi:hypothetical protein